FSDPNDSPPDNPLFMSLTAIPASTFGDFTIQLPNGDPYTLGDDLPNHKFKLTPPPNATGSFPFTVRIADCGDTADCGPLTASYASSTVTLTLNVVPV